jgi:hypothetical protein
MHAQAESAGHGLSVPHSVSQSACVILLYIMAPKGFIISGSGLLPPEVEEQLRRRAAAKRCQVDRKSIPFPARRNSG